MARTHKELEYSENTDSILLGYDLGSAETDHGVLHVRGSGKLVRFTLEGVDGYVDLDISNFAAGAYEWLAERKEAKAQ